jgi:hypothetical protein
MKPLICTLALAYLGGVVLAEDRVVIIPKDNTPFTVNKSDLVRFSEKGIAGSKIEAKVDGPAKLESTSLVREFRDGKPLIGNVVKEFEVKPTNLGKVTVTITVTPPQPSAQPRILKFEFDVK